MSHTHGPEEWRKPCRFRTKKLCDENYTQFTHGHLGWECVKEFQPAKSTTHRKDGTVITRKGEPSSVATCTIPSVVPDGASFEQSLAIQLLSAPETYRAEHSRGTLNANPN